MEQQPYLNYQTARTTSLPIRKLLTGTIAVLVVIIGIEVALAVSTRNKTGILSVSAPSGTNISISAVNSSATNIGIGNAKLRLDPGSYLLMGVKNGYRGDIVATVTKGQITTVALQPYSTVPRSVQNINFQGDNGLINAGLSVNQLDEIEQDIFDYSSTANTVVIDQNSIEPGAHNPNTDIGFSLGFNLTIDGTSYQAVVSYVNTEDTSLKLLSASGQTVFDSGSTQQTGGD
jgi:hypothetical protein